MVHSMTGFANLQGTCAAGAWMWDMRSVNGRGLDIRIRLPEGFEALEPELKKAVGARFQRGNISISLRVKLDEGQRSASVNQEVLRAVLGAVDKVEQTAMDTGVTLSPMSAADILSLRGVLDGGASGDLVQSMQAACKDNIPTLLDAFETARGQEGAAIKAVLLQTLDDIAHLHQKAGEVAEKRLPKIKAGLAQNVQRLLDADQGLDADRLAQELALLAVKSDVTEELDRLFAHVDAGRKLLEAQGPIGRNFDFLTQEFNREVNTLCSKSGDIALTEIGLTLKTKVDQMREQVQNVE